MIPLAAQGPYKKFDTGVRPLSQHNSLPPTPASHGTHSPIRPKRRRAAKLGMVFKVQHCRSTKQVGARAKENGFSSPFCSRLCYFAGQSIVTNNLMK